ncbi:MAG: lysine--tRNA ligase, partial [Oscillospiraceae bacterium]|nr:lysine--tRNA ligase [Oscillospiraceae bacterium]
MAENRLNGSAQPLEPDENEQIAIRREKLSAMREEGNDPFLVTTYDVTDYAKDIVGSFSDDDPQVTVSVAGRVMTRRIMGKASFFNLQDSSGTIQVYTRRDDVGEETYARFKKWDIGDILGVKGYVFRTQTGEITIHASELVLLSKSLRPLPEKFHGLTDSDTIYRKRYLDLITNPDSKEVFRRRSAIIAAIRSFLDDEGFMEVETTMLVSNAGGAAARPFLTHFNALDEDFKLRISLELYLKRLIVGGFDRVFEIGRVFRNEGIDTRHNPEFTMMELYQAYTDYNGMMDLTERMLRYVAQKVLGTTTIVYRGTEMDLSRPFERITMVDAVKEYAGIDWKEVATLEDARRVADSLKVEYKEFHGKGDILNEIFDAYVEEHLVQPTFLMDHPVEISPLTKRKPEDPDYVERFEFYMNGWEMANAYTELNDPVDQRERFAAQEEKLAHGDEEANHTDEDFLEAMETGMPPLGGIGYGIDRLIMLLTGAEAIRDVLLFPTLRSIKTGSENAEAEKTAENASPEQPVAMP